MKTYIDLYIENTSISIETTHIPKLDIGERVGATDYIDFIRWKEVTSPVMWGIDRFSRTFFVVKCIVNGKHKLMQTFFQRYTQGSQWQGCGHATTTFLETCGVGLSLDQINLIKDIIDNKKVYLEEKHRFNGSIKSQDYVELYDEKKESAAICIQRYWRLCRYDPNYEMCHKVQHNNMKELWQT